MCSENKEGTLFSKVTDCSECPFNNDSDYCESHPDGYHPCIYRKDKYKDMTIEEVRDSIDADRFAHESYEERQWELEQLESEKKRKRAQKAKETRDRNYLIDHSIRLTKRDINNIESARSRHISLIGAFSITNSMLSDKGNISKEPEIKETPFDKRLEDLNKKLEELKKRKATMNNEFREKQKKEEYQDRLKYSLSLLEKGFTISALTLLSYKKSIIGVQCKVAYNDGYLLALLDKKSFKTLKTKCPIFINICVDDIAIENLKRLNNNKGSFTIQEIIQTKTGYTTNINKQNKDHVLEVTEKATIAVNLAITKLLDRLETSTN